MKMSGAIITIKNKVFGMLSQYPETRDSDKLLWLAYLCTFHNLKSQLGDEAYLVLKRIIMDEKTPTMESIRRVRQKIQEEGTFIGEKRAQRLEEEQKVRDVINKL